MLPEHLAVPKVLKSIAAVGILNVSQKSLFKGLVPQVVYWEVEPSGKEDVFSLFEGSLGTPVPFSSSLFLLGNEASNSVSLHSPIIWCCLVTGPE